jgi:cytosine/adenosine deaminase-related metal-dependent hydrolase
MNDKLIRGGTVLTDPAALPDGGLLEEAAVLVRGDSVAEVGPYEELRQRHPQAEQIGSASHVVMPGLINTHHHGWGITSFQLGTLDDYLEQWIPVIWGLKPLDRYLEVLYGDLQNLRSGVTTHLHAAYFRDWAYSRSFRDHTYASLRAHADSGIRTSYAVQVLNRNTFVYEDDDEFLPRLPRELAETLREFVGPTGSDAVPDDYFELLETIHAKFADSSRTRIMLAPVNPVWCTDALLQRARQAADSLGTGLHIHLNETPFQRQYTNRLYGRTAVAHLERLGILGPDVSLGHAVWLDENDMDICAATGTSICHNPTSNLRLRNGILPVARMLEKGVNVSIGMDGNSFADDEDMLAEMRLAHKLSLLPRGLEPAGAPTSFDILRMATVNGARSAGQSPAIGSLLPGSKADIVVLDGGRMRYPYTAPSIHVVDSILYRAKHGDVETVLVDGEVVLRDRQFVNVDEAETAQRLRALAEAPPSPEVARWQQAMAELQRHTREFYTGWPAVEERPCYAVNCGHEAAARVPVAALEEEAS